MSGLFLLAQPLIIQAHRYNASASLTFAGGLSLTAQNWSKRQKKRKYKIKYSRHGWIPQVPTQLRNYRVFCSEKSHANSCYSFCSSKILLALLPPKLVEPLCQAIWHIKIHLHISLSSPLILVILPLTNEISPSPPNCSSYTLSALQCPRKQIPRLFQSEWSHSVL